MRSMLSTLRRETGMETKTNHRDTGIINDELISLCEILKDF